MSVYSVTAFVAAGAPTLDTSLDIDAKLHDPLPAFDIVSLRESFDRLTPTERHKLDELLTNDPHLERISSKFLDQMSYIKDLSHELASIVAADISKSFSLRAQCSLEPLIDFYFGYRRSFPDPTEIQSLKGIYDMFDHLPNWDAVMARNNQGQIIAACSGQVVDVPCKSGNFRINWNEHTWVDEALRGKQLGVRISNAFEAIAYLKTGVVGTVLEIDNALLLSDFSKDSPGYGTNKAKRKEFWTVDKGLAMDPISRWEFWSRQGYGLMCYEVDGKKYPVPYCQISLDLGVVGSCETINQVFKPKSAKFANFFNEERYAALFEALQLTIDDDAAFYPEWVRTHNQIKAIPDNAKFSIVSLTDPNIYEIFALAGMYKEEYKKKDLEYCMMRLAANDVSENERHILQQTEKQLRSLLST